MRDDLGEWLGPAQADPVPENVSDPAETADQGHGDEAPTPAPAGCDPAPAGG